MTEKVIDSIRCYLRIDGLRIEAGNLLCPLINAIDSVGSPYPYIFVFVFTYLTDIIVTDRCRVIYFVLVYFKFITVVTVCSVTCPKPYVSFRILKYTENRYLRKPVFNTEMGKKERVFVFCIYSDEVQGQDQGKHQSVDNSHIYSSLVFRPYCALARYPKRTIFCSSNNVRRSFKAIYFEQPLMERHSRVEIVLFCCM